MGMAAPNFYTADMVRALPDDGNRYETVHGELLVTPAPRVIHQVVQARLQLALANYLERQPVGLVLASPADISWAPDTLVQPDLFVAQRDELRGGVWRAVRTLLLAVEILSPSTARQDRFTKRRLYQDVGVPAAWFVDCDQHHVEVWTPDALFPVIEQKSLRWTPAGAGEGLNISLETLFAPI